MSRPAVLLSIAGFDPSGGAGLQADIETANALGMRIVCAQTCNTIQDSCAASACRLSDPQWLKRQIASLFNDFNIAAVKVGLLGSIDIIQAVGESLEKKRLPLVLDPVFYDGSGHMLMSRRAIHPLCQLLLPLVSVLTPNRRELFMLAPADSLERAAGKLLSTGCQGVFVSSGHIEKTRLRHSLYQSDQPTINIESRRLPREYHGSGCTLSTAVAVQLARGEPLELAARQAHDFTMRTLVKAQQLGRGRYFPKRL